MQKVLLPLDLAKELYRKACLGRLVGGMIHNINGPLHALGMELDMIRLVLGKAVSGGSDPEALNKRLEALDREIENLDRITRINAARADDGSPPPFLDLNGLIREESEFLQANLYYKHKVQSLLDLAQGMPLIETPPEGLVLGVQWLFREVVTEMERRKATSLQVVTRYESETPTLCFCISGRPVSNEFARPFLAPLDGEALACTTLTDLGLILSLILLKANGVSPALEKAAGMSRIQLAFSSMGSRGMV